MSSRKTGAAEAIPNSSRHLFLPCSIVKKLEESGSSGDECVLVKTSDGVLHRINDVSKLTRVTPEDRKGVDDILHLPNVTEASLLHTLRLRYGNDKIYTNSGPILISVNPYKTISVGGEGIYSEEKMFLYRNEHSGPHSDTQASILEDSAAPHLFGVGNRAYNALLNFPRSDFFPHKGGKFRFNSM